MFKYFNRVPLGEYRIIRKWYGYRIEALYMCYVYWNYHYVGTENIWFKAAKKDIKRINKKLK